MCMCMHVCTFVCFYVYMHVCLYVCVCTPTLEMDGVEPFGLSSTIY